MSAAIASGSDPFPDRSAANALTVELFVRIHETIRDWSTWAETEVRTWPPVRRRRRIVAAGTPERGRELFAAIARRTVA